MTVAVQDIATGAERAARIRAVRGAATTNGIAFVEVISADQRTLALTFVHPLPGEPGEAPPGLDPLGAANIRIHGGVRVTAIAATGVAAANRVLTVTLDGAGDFSIYTLSLVAGPGSDARPAGFDPVLSVVGLNFKVGCRSDLDCLPDLAPDAPSRPAPPIDYLARDWPSFRRTMLDRMSVTAPDWRERNPADTMVTVVEALAALADRVAYLQDGVATESYLGTARLRPSLRRHARLLDYRLHDGCNARAWIALSVQAGGGADDVTLPRGTAIAALGRDAPSTLDADAASGVTAGAVIFETLHAQRLSAPRSDMELYDWSGAQPCLRTGATEAHILRTPGLMLAPGDVVILEERASPETGLEADKNPAHRWAVRLSDVAPIDDPLDATALLRVRWSVADALPFDLAIGVEVLIEGVPTVVRTARALGNVVLADHGFSTAGAPGLTPPSAPGNRAYRPKLGRGGLVFREGYDHAAALGAPASGMLEQDPRRALPAILLEDEAETWAPQADLLGSDRFAREFVVEPDGARGTFLRFGDDVHGKQPAVGRVFVTHGRIGGGVAGNLGRDSLGTVITDLAGIATVRNPLAARGGRPPETAEELRRYAPQVFRTQARAVTAADWIRVAEAFPEVERARAELRWTGSWYTVFLTVDRAGSAPVRGDADFADRLLSHLDVFRLAGYDLELRDPVFVALDIDLIVCLSPGYVAGDVLGRLNEVFAAVDLPGGGRGFFHPDNFSFGDPLHLSQIYAAALAVDGVASLQPVRFHPRGALPSGEIGAGRIVPGDAAILRCDSDANRPENGVITFDPREAP